MMFHQYFILRQHIDAEKARSWSSDILGALLLSSESLLVGVVLKMKNSWQLKIKDIVTE